MSIRRLLTSGGSEPVGSGSKDVFSSSEGSVGGGETNSVEEGLVLRAISVVPLSEDESSSWPEVEDVGDGVPEGLVDLVSDGAMV
jgi:hypothetical protein